MTSDVDQRHLETSRLRVDEPQNPDDVDTDRSLTPVSLQRPPHEPWSAGEPHAAVEESPWRLNALGAALLTALLCCLLLIAGLKLKLNQARAALAEAESAAEAAESAVAREPAEEPAAPPPAKHAQPELAEPVPAPPLVAARAPLAASTLILDGPAKRPQLVLLLTVGTQHFAEKQVRALKHKCSAPLAVYRQRRGRCAYSQCFAVAVPIEDADAASGCGRVRGQSVRDRDDFVLP